MKDVDLVWLRGPDRSQQHAFQVIKWAASPPAVSAFFAEAKRIESDCPSGRKMTRHLGLWRGDRVKPVPFVPPDGRQGITPW
jgi:hypothetical protein